MINYPHTLPGVSDEYSVYFGGHLAVNYVDIFSGSCDEYSAFSHMSHGAVPRYFIGHFTVNILDILQDLPTRMFCISLGV